MIDCKFFNFPKIPAELIETIIPGELINSYPVRTCISNNFQFETSLGRYYHVNSELDQWIRNNINADIDFVGIRYQYGSKEQSCHGAHSDATRNYALLYSIDNADGYLQFWQDPNLELELTRGHIVKDYTNLKKLQKYETPAHAWYLINGQIIHSVEAMTRTRITLQINLNSLKGLEI